MAVLQLVIPKEMEKVLMQTLLSMNGFDERNYSLLKCIQVIVIQYINQIYQK